MARGATAPANIRPLIAAPVAHNPAAMASRQVAAPPALVANAALKSPRNAYDQAVVIPQVGQGQPVRVMNQQGTMPNCSCVP